MVSVAQVEGGLGPGRVYLHVTVLLLLLPTVAVVSCVVSVRLLLVVTVMVVLLLGRSRLLHLQVLRLRLLLLCTGESVWTLYYTRQGCGYPTHLSDLLGHGALVAGAPVRHVRLDPVRRPLGVLGVVLAYCPRRSPG